jgi:soluble lytic murein transglycosylase-like protein
MQIMPSTAAGLGVDPTDPAQAVDSAARYLARQLDRSASVEPALAAYNAGPAAVSRFGGVPPFPETQGYVARVLGYQAEADARIGATS